MRSNANHAVAAVTAAAIALTTAGVAPAFAASKTSTSVKPVETAAANTDISSRRYHRGYGYRNNAAGAAFAAPSSAASRPTPPRANIARRASAAITTAVTAVGRMAITGNGYYGGGRGYYRLVGKPPNLLSA